MPRPAVSGIATALTLVRPGQRAAAAFRPASTASRRSRRVRSMNRACDRVSSEIVTRSSPAAASAPARSASPTALVVIAISGRGASAATASTIDSRSRRTSGSPPVMRTRRTPRDSTAIRTSRTSSAPVSRPAAGVSATPSAGMQYLHRNEHLSVTDRRRSVATRPNRSSNSGTSGRAGAGPGRSARRISGQPSVVALTPHCRSYPARAAAYRPLTARAGTSAAATEAVGSGRRRTSGVVACR